MSELSLDGICVTETEQLVELMHGTVITGAVLGAEIVENVPTSLVIKYDNGDSGVLCTLVPGILESISLNLFVRPGECFRLHTNNKNTIFLNRMTDRESAGAEQTNYPVSLSIVHLRAGERLLLTGSALYTTCSLVSCSTPRVSLCALINGQEVTLTNLIPTRIETAAIALETFDSEEIELFLVGEGEVDLVGYTNPEGDFASEEEFASDDELDEEFDEASSDANSDSLASDQSAELPEENSTPIDDNEYLSVEQTKQLAGKENRPVTSQTVPELVAEPQPRLSREELKAQRKKDELKQLKIVDVQKSKNRERVRKDDTVRVRYSLFVNGELIDRSKASGIVFRLGENRMVKGFELGLEGMTPGSKRVITIPPQLGYQNARVGSIPPNSTLVFRVDLIAIVKK